MGEARVDRRVGRTRSALKKALLELIVERGYGKVSIRDVTERADVGRSTFYSHFASKEDLLFDGFDRWLLSRAEAPTDDESPGREDRFRFSRPFLAHIGHERRFFEAFIGRDAGARVRRKTIELVCEVVRVELRRIAPDPAGDARLQEARVQLLVGAFIGLASWWVDDACRRPVEEVDGVFQSMALDGLRR